MPEWKDTVNLPRTDFPMKANLPTSEPDTLARWVAAGHLTPVRIGHARFFPADDFHRLVGRKLDQRIHDRHHK